MLTSCADISTRCHSPLLLYSSAYYSVGILWTHWVGVSASVSLRVYVLQRAAKPLCGGIDLQIHITTAGEDPSLWSVRASVYCTAGSTAGCMGVLSL